MKSLARALWLVLRRRSDVPPDGAAIGYSGVLRPLFWALLAVNPVDIVLVEVLVKIDWLRIVLLMLGILGLLWFVALVATLYKYPHAIGRDGLRIRYLAFFDSRIPLAKIASVRQANRSRELRRGVDVVEDGVLAVEVMKSTNVSVTLAEPHPVAVRRTGAAEITQLDFWADDPRAAVAEIRQRLESAVAG